MPHRFPLQWRQPGRWLPGQPVAAVRHPRVSEGTLWVEEFEWTELGSSGKFCGPAYEMWDVGERVSGELGRGGFFHARAPTSFLHTHTQLGEGDMDVAALERKRGADVVGDPLSSRV